MTDELVVKIVVAVLGSGAFSALVSGFVAWLKDKRGEGKCLMMLMADAVYTKGEKLSSQSEVSREEKKLFDDMYDLYKKQGGNGYADDLKEAVKKIPVKK